MISNQFSAHKRNIIGCCIMGIRISQTTTVDKMCVFHTKFQSALIHSVHKALLTPCNMFCHCNTGIIPGSNDNAFDHGLNVLLFALFKKDL